MEKFSQNINKSKRQSNILYIASAAILFLIVAFLYMYSNGIGLFNLNRGGLSKEEKLDILNAISKNFESSLSVEEKQNIIDEVSKNKPEDSKKISDEDKLKILRSLD